MAQAGQIATRLFGWITFLAIIGVPLALWSNREPVVDVTAMTITIGRVEQTITAIASGTVLAEEDAMVAAELLGKITGVYVNEGDRVSLGDLMVELNHAELDAQVALAEANLRVGLSRAEQVRLGATIYEQVAAAQVGQTSAQLEQTRSDFRRMDALSKERAVSRMELDKAALALKVAREANAGAEATQQENLVRQEEVRAAETSLEQLEAARDAANATREKAFVRAPFDGIVARVLVDIGEAVMVGAPVLQVVRDTSVYIKAPFDEANAAEVAVGQPARINIDAYRGRDFPGTVEQISPVVTLNPDLSRSLDIRLRIEEGQDALVPGMSADVVIVADQKDDALFVPSEAIVRQRYCYIIEDGRARRRELILGVGNWDTTEVLAGVTRGDQIITSVALNGLDDGTRVQVVDELADP
jgi:HlyD family secretion protein